MKYFSGLVLTLTLTLTLACSSDDTGGNQRDGSSNRDSHETAPGDTQVDGPETDANVTMQGDGSDTDADVTTQGDDSTIIDANVTTLGDATCGGVVLIPGGQIVGTWDLDQMWFDPGPYYTDNECGTNVTLRLYQNDRRYYFIEDGKILIDGNILASEEESNLLVCFEEMGVGCVEFGEQMKALSTDDISCVVAQDRCICTYKGYAELLLDGVAWSTGEDLLTVIYEDELPKEYVYSAIGDELYVIEKDEMGTTCLKLTRAESTQ